MNLVYENICVRNAEFEDCGQLAAWWNDGRVMAHAGFPNGIGITADEIRKKIAEDSDETTRHMVIEYSGRLIGETNYTVYEDDKYEIGIKICETDYQEKGIGRLVLSMIIEELFGRGAKLIFLDTNLKNTRAQHVYESLGFRKVAVNIDSWEDQLGNLQSSVDYELVRENFVNFKRINLIFDCDGTLVDSYPATVDSIKRLFAAHEIEYESEEIRQLALHHSVTYCITELSRKSGLDPEKMLKELNNYPENIDVIKLYPDEKKLLSDKRFRSFVFTHRGESCGKIFEKLGIEECFEEIVDATYHFRRKPDSQGIDYLVNKYSLDKRRTYYVGDRIIDIESGKNAGVGVIFVNSSGLDIDTSNADYVVDELADIRKLSL